MMAQITRNNVYLIYAILSDNVSEHPEYYRIYNSWRHFRQQRTLHAKGVLLVCFFHLSLTISAIYDFYDTIDGYTVIKDPPPEYDDYILPIIIGVVVVGVALIIIIIIICCCVKRRRKNNQIANEEEEEKGEP